MVMDIDEIIEMFNDGDLDIKTYFNDSETFFKIMTKRGVIDELDLEDQYMVNDYLFYLSQHNTEKFVEEIQKYLSDVVFEPGKEPILQVYNRGDLAKLFCDSRNDISRDTIGELLEGDYAWDQYWDTTDDVYHDVIDELNEENLGYLSSYMLKNLDGQGIEVDEDSPELLQDYSNDEDVFYLTPENVRDIINDDESMNFLMDNHLDELRGELSNIHSNAYNQAYESEIYEGVWNKLDDIFVTDKKEWKYIPHPYRKETQIEVLEVPIRDFYTPMKEFVYNNQGTNYTPEYYGDFIKILEENGDCLTYWAPDYADSSRTDKNINEIFGDYIG
jgi:hypothetical protein